MILSLLSFFVIPAAVLRFPLNAQSDLVDLEDIAHMKAGHQKVEGGVMIDMKTGLYTVKTPTGAMLTVTEAAVVRHGHGVPKIVDEMTLWVNEGNTVIDAHMKGQSDKSHRFISGTLASFDNAKSQMTLPTSGGEKNFKLTPESRVFRNIAPGA